MSVRKIRAIACKCERCGATWTARGEKPPVRCAKCRSPYWNVPKKGDA